MAMATPIRKKRNFKALQLDVSLSATPKDPEPVPTRVAPTTTVAKSKKRPPPMTLNAPKLGQTPAANDTDGCPPVANGLLSASGTGAASSRRNTYHATLSNTLANLDMNAETRFDLRNEDLKDLQELGQGNGGSVKKVEHIPSKMIMAKKASTINLISLSADIYSSTVDQIVLIDAKPSVRKQILRELHIMHDCHSPYIISFFGAFLSDPNICICMEFMDKGSLDGIYKRIGAIDIDVVGKVALAVLEGLTYLYDVHRIIHRGMDHVPLYAFTLTLESIRYQTIKYLV